MRLQNIIEKNKQKETLIKKYGSVCGYCKTSLGMASEIVLNNYRSKRLYPELDNDINNKVLACRACSFSKAGVDPILSDGRIVLLNPYIHEYSEHMKMNEKYEMIGTTEEGESTIIKLNLNRQDLINYRQSNVGEFALSITDTKHSPYTVYVSSIENLKQLIYFDKIDKTMQNYLYRMLYANIISLMESYLSKTIMMLVSNNEDLKWSFVKNYNWNNEKIIYNNLKEGYDNIDSKIQVTLSEILYHNLPSVRSIYHKILEINILTDENEMDYLCKAVNIRHDIVHRNGRSNKATENNEKYHEITIISLEELLNAVDKLINSIESQIKDKNLVL